MRALLALVTALIVPALPVLAAEDGGKPRADYLLYCAGCHGMQGLGTVEGGIPAFPDSVAHIAGIDIGRTYIMHVPGVISTELDAADTANVLNYILDQWGDGKDHFTAKEVVTRKAIPIGDVVVYRRKVVEELARSGITLAEYPWP